MKNANALFRSRRLWGLVGTALIFFLVFEAVAGIKVPAWLMPPTNQIAQAMIDVWPQLPFFVQKESAPGGGQLIYYTVPTRQLTAQELARMGVTNRLAHPVAPTSAR